MALGSAEQKPWTPEHYLQIRGSVYMLGHHIHKDLQPCTRPLYIQHFFQKQLSSSSYSFVEQLTTLSDYLNWKFLKIGILKIKFAPTQCHGLYKNRKFITEEITFFISSQQIFKNIVGW